MIVNLLKKYRWQLVALVALYTAISFWLFFLTESPQSVPFQYQLR